MIRYIENNCSKRAVHIKYVRRQTIYETLYLNLGIKKAPKQRHFFKLITD